MDWLHITLLLLLAMAVMFSFAALTSASRSSEARRRDLESYATETERLHHQQAQELLDQAAKLEDRRVRTRVGATTSTKGQVLDRIVAILPGFPYDPSDMWPVHGPIDYVTFKGLTDSGNDPDEGDAVELVLVEVKTMTGPKSRPSFTPSQRKLRKALKAGVVARYECLEITTDYHVHIAETIPIAGPAGDVSTVQES